MTVRENTLAVLNYEKFDALPIVHFGYWDETLEKWAAEGHITLEEGIGWSNWGDTPKKQGFDFEWGGPCDFAVKADLFPAFDWKLISEASDGTKTLQNHEGVTVIQKAGAGSIPAEVDHLLKDRASWEEHYLPRLQYTPDRVDLEKLNALPAPSDREMPAGLFCGSLFGTIRNWLGQMMKICTRKLSIPSPISFIAQPRTPSKPACNSTTLTSGKTSASKTVRS